MTGTHITWNIKMILKEIVGADVAWIHVDQNSDQ
jgi:hypothetical protein